MKLFNELNIKMKLLNENRNSGLNQQKLNFATYRQPWCLCFYTSYILQCPVSSYKNKIEYANNL